MFPKTSPSESYYTRRVASCQIDVTHSDLFTLLAQGVFLPLTQFFSNSEVSAIPNQK